MPTLRIVERVSSARSTRVALSSFLLAGAACVAADAPEGRVQQPILGGQVDTRHTAVVALRQYAEGAEELCSGTLISIDSQTGTAAVLTAAHCVDRVPSEVIVGTDYEDGHALRYAPFDVSKHPSYRMGDETSPYDLAVVRIAGDVSSLTALSVGSELEPALRVEQAVTSVGFGLSTVELDAASSTERRSVDVQIADLTPLELRVEQGAGKGICYGDSGGPVLARDGAGVERVVGVHSRLDPQDPSVPDCLAPSISSRVGPARDFLATALAADAPNQCSVCRARQASEGGRCLILRRSCEEDDACRVALHCSRACGSAFCRQKCYQNVPRERLAQLDVIDRCTCETCTEACPSDECVSEPSLPQGSDAGLAGDGGTNRVEDDVTLDPEGAGCACSARRDALRSGVECGVLAVFFCCARPGRGRKRARRGG